MSNEVIDTVTGEVLEEKMLAVKSESQKALSSLVKDADKALFAAMSDLQSMDWKNLQPNQMALLLMQKPFPVSGGGVAYLNLRQALLFALRSFELGLSPLSSEVFYNTATGSVNVTLEGKRALARNRNIDLGPPVFAETSRAWDAVPRMTQAAEEAKKMGFTSDVGVTCKMRIGPSQNNEHVEFTAYLSEWFVSRSAVWKEKPQWMLSVRSQDKCLVMALGAGVSDAAQD